MREPRSSRSTACCAATPGDRARDPAAARRAADGRPAAELWFGAHAGRPVAGAGGTTPGPRCSPTRGDGRAAVPAEDARRRAGAVDPGAPEPRPGRGRLRPRAGGGHPARRPRAQLRRPQPQAGAAVRADPVRGAVRVPAGRRDARAARRARRCRSSTSSPICCAGRTGCGRRSPASLTTPSPAVIAAVRARGDRPTGRCGAVTCSPSTSRTTSGGRSTLLLNHVRLEPGRGDLPRRRQRALLPARHRRRDHGQQRQRAALRTDAEAHRRRPSCSRSPTSRELTEPRWPDAGRRASRCRCRTSARTRSSRASRRRLRGGPAHRARRRRRVPVDGVEIGAGQRRVRPAAAGTRLAAPAGVRGLAASGDGLGRQGAQGEGVSFAPK